MESKKVGVIWSARSEKLLQKIYNFIAKDSIEQANIYIDKLIDFGDSLGFLPLKFPVCRHKSFAKRKMHCAVFDKNYIFIHAMVKKELRIFNVIPACRIR